ncbi:hypothetical protein TU94_28645 [Streptomyces cyaneogriseus subsp. noncyanogenus]|uniref:Uncharacterized protein n=1 Tax=Streptomyces cyaneogriseus subsp. noncyanogenus TaxID=477245 RepID=A0A0C5G7S7_9ACTN|nr:hypothetical protein [Streptomyces cyaneogriseus]AJP04825.1 hypothetical protein TU94_28645 [Streptomyces cyaneogriseus subsp. noncyanogenus]
MTTAVPTDRERRAVQTYLRLLHTVRAAFDTADGPPGAGGPSAGPPVTSPVVPPAVLAEADEALRAAGLAGNEEAFFRLVRGWCPPRP